jgi:hypothetical protein
MNGLHRLALALTVAGALTFVTGASALPILDLRDTVRRKHHR